MSTQIPDRGDLSGEVTSRRVQRDVGQEMWISHLAAIRTCPPAVLAAASGAALLTLSTPAFGAVGTASAVAVVALWPAALVDVATARLPNALVGLGAIVLLVAAAVTLGVGDTIDTRGAALGAAAMAGPLLALHLASPTAMGFGDVKAATVLGAAVGLVHPLVAVIALTAASLAATAVGVALRRRTVVFGPWLVAGAGAALLLAAWFPSIAEGRTR